jgi:hypothetical protein
MVYPVTPPLSVLAVQDKLICDEDIAVATNPAGVLGGVLSTDPGGTPLGVVPPPLPESAQALSIIEASAMVRM